MPALFLPLHRLANILEAVTKGIGVPRGTICTSLTYVPFPECIRLGVDQSFVKNCVLEGERFPAGTFDKECLPTGMLMVQKCIPGSDAACRCVPGDILLEIEDKPCCDFIQLDIILDGAVGQKIHMALCREGRRVDVEVQVQDAFGMIPSAFFELGLGVFHEVQLAGALHMERVLG